jgi:hypothetical protein
MAIAKTVETFLMMLITLSIMQLSCSKNEPLPMPSLALKHWQQEAFQLVFGPFYRRLYRDFG